MKYLRTISPTIGADPELFIASSKDGKIIESSKIIPKSGLDVYENSYSKCTIDGVQAELNPNAGSCREGAGGEYIAIFKKLVETLSRKKATMSFKSMVYFTKNELDKLSDDSKKFGCKPSIDNYTNKKSVITVDPNVYGYRSAGGHIHLGAGIGSNLRECIDRRPKLIVRLLDLVLGNTCVMIDRDPNQVERRKVYGRAGEYRLPNHGLEYRTLSNFWIRNYQLMSMVYGFARLSLCIAYNIYTDEKPTLSIGKSDFRKILKASNKRNVRRAINNNDFNLAKKNWDDIKHILVSMIPVSSFDRYPINSKYLDAFEHFIDRGLDYWFKDNLVTHWTKKLVNVYNKGWERFLAKVVTTDLENKGNITWLMTERGFSIEFKPKKEELIEVM